MHALAGCQAMGMEQSKLKEQYHDMAVSKVVTEQRHGSHITPLPKPTERREYDSDINEERSYSSVHRTKLLSTSKDLLANKKYELQSLLKRSREHNEMLRNELHTPIQLGASSSR